MSYIKSNLKELEISGILEYHNKNILGNGVTIAILENTLNSTLKMFKGKVKTLEKKNGQLKEVINTSESTRNSHAQKEVDILMQVLPEVDKIYCLPTSFSNIEGYVRGSILDSLQFIIDKKIDIVSSSIGGVGHPQILKLIKKAKEQGTIFFNAIGNSGKESTDTFVNTGEFIDVGAVGYSDKYKEVDRYLYSSTGEKLEVMTFVLDIRDATNEDRVFSISGTSFSTPFLAGIIGLLKSYLKTKNKMIYQNEVLELIKYNAIDLGEKGKDELNGYGLFVLPHIDKLDIKKYKNINKKEGEIMSNTKFEDIEKHWAKENIQKVIDAGLMNGYEDGTFKPNEHITRAEIATILARVLKL